MLVVSFTTIPPRFRHLGGIVSALEQQSVCPDRVELTLPKTYRRFPGARPALPPLPDWIDVIEVEHDFGPSTKVVPALGRWRGRDVDLLYCDDDKTYDPGWIARLKQARVQHPGKAICERGGDIARFGTFERKLTPEPQPRAMRARGQGVSEATLWHDPTYRPTEPFYRALETAGHVDIMMGSGGVLVRPDSFHEDVAEDPDLIWPVDDIWLSGMAAARGTAIWATAELIPSPMLTEVDRTEPLLLMASDGLGRKELNWLAINWFRETYGIWA